MDSTLTLDGANPEFAKLLKEIAPGESCKIEATFTRSEDGSSFSLDDISDYQPVDENTEEAGESKATEDKEEAGGEESGDSDRLAGTEGGGDDEGQPHSPMPDALMVAIKSSRKGKASTL